MSTPRVTAPVSAVIALAGAVVLLCDIVPVWLLSVTTIYGQAGSTSVLAMAGFALLWFLLPVLVVPVCRFTGALPLVAVLAGVARLVLQADLGPWAQVYASSIALCATLSGIVLLTAKTWSERGLATGLMAGIAVSATLQVALAGRDAMWRGGVTGWVPPVVICGVFVTASLGCRRSHGPAPTGMAWFVLGPALVLAMILTGAPIRSAVTVLPTHGWRRLIVVAACVVACAAVARVRRRSTRVMAAMLLVAATCAAVLPRVATDGVHGVWPWWQVLPQAVAAVALGALLGAATERTRPPTVRVALAAWLGLLVFFLAVFCYFAPQEMALPYPPSAVLVVCALIVAAVGVLHRTSDPVRRPLPAVAVALVVALAVSAQGAARSIPSDPVVGEGLPVRMVSYNVHVGGVSQNGRYDPEAIAEVLRAEHPDVVWLSEVDRGWLVDGRHDILPWLADRLDMTYVFAPASGPDWGDAVLSRYPVTVEQQRPLPDAGALTGAQAMAVQVQVGPGARLGIVGTHLQTKADNATVPVAQARVVADMATDLAGHGMPVVVTGDLNAAPGSGSLAPMDDALTDGLHRWRPVFTSPADHPRQQLDQVYLTGPIHLTHLRVPDTTASDHRPVAFTVARSR